MLNCCWEIEEDEKEKSVLGGLRWGSEGFSLGKMERLHGFNKYVEICDLGMLEEEVEPFGGKKWSEKVT